LQIFVEYRYIYSSTLKCNIYAECYSVGSDLTGFQEHCSWTQKSKTKNIVNSGKQLNVSVTGIHGWYVGLPTGGYLRIQYHSEVETYSTSFTNP